MDAFGGAAGYSFFGVVDLDFSIFKASPREDIAGNGLKVFSYSPEITVYLLKQNETSIPLSFAVSANYERDSYSSAQLAKFNQTLVGDYFWYSGTIYENIKISPAAYIQPAAVVGYSAGTNKLRYTGGYTETRNNDALLYGVGVSVVGRNSPSGQVAFTPAFLFTKKVTIFSLDLDFIIETSH